MPLQFELKPHSRAYKRGLHSALDSRGVELMDAMD